MWQKVAPVIFWVASVFFRNQVASLFSFLLPSEPSTLDSGQHFQDWAAMHSDRLKVVGQIHHQIRCKLASQIRFFLATFRFVTNFSWTFYFPSFFFFFCILCTRIWRKLHLFELVTWMCFLPNSLLFQSLWSSGPSELEKLLAKQQKHSKQDEPPHWVRERKLWLSSPDWRTWCVWGRRFLSGGTHLSSLHRSPTSGSFSTSCHHKIWLMLRDTDGWNISPCEKGNRQ